MPLRLPKRLSALVAAAIALGLALSVYWFLRLGLADLRARLSQLHLPLLLAVLGLVVAALLLRMLRWHFLLRSADFPVRPADSARFFLAALVMVLTPGYVGELIKAYWLRRRYAIAMRSSVPLIFFERFFDALALTMLFLAAASSRPSRALALLLVLSVVLGVLWRFFCPACLGLASLLGRIRLVLFLRHSPAETPADVERLRSPYFFSVAFVLSLLAWAPVAYSLRLVAASLGRALPAADAVRIFSGGTLLGGMSLIPGGIAVAGSWFIRELQRAGFPLDEAVLGAALLRFLTFWFAFGVGAIAYVFFTRRAEAPPNLGKMLHFDEVSSCYDAQIPEHVRDLLVERKTERMLAVLRASSAPRSAAAAAPAGLDVGCGLGWYTARMTERGWPTIGLDLSLEQARRARRRTPTVAAADALALPFADETFDFAYCINALRHLPGREAQRRAFQEIARVLKPGGWLFLHEINVRNPLFRFYMGYVFPLVRKIDEGTEHWIDPRALARLQPWLEPSRIDYFTFLPDFTPRPVMKMALRIETLLEKTPLRVWSAHYMAALRKRGEGLEEKV
jgi:SAM-dependent methyltransferase/uncharacterized membrane protein YbhN (UPF0104 family)